MSDRCRSRRLMGRLQADSATVQRAGHAAMQTCAGLREQPAATRCDARNRSRSRALAIARGGAKRAPPCRHAVGAAACAARSPDPRLRAPAARAELAAPARCVRDQAQRAARHSVGDLPVRIHGTRALEGSRYLCFCIDSRFIILALYSSCQMRGGCWPSASTRTSGSGSVSGASYSARRNRAPTLRSCTSTARSLISAGALLLRVDV